VDCKVDVTGAGNTSKEKEMLADDDTGRLTFVNFRVQNGSANIQSLGPMGPSTMNYQLSPREYHHVTWANCESGAAALWKGWCVSL